tara:strand:+ start:593 stop:1105 length:513 start_codon:yes stop_codon:yes gene_type:complete
MQIEVYEIEEPKAPNVEQGWEGRKTYKVTDRNMALYYANPENVKGIATVKVGDKLDIKFTEKVYSGKPIKFLNSFTPINHMTATNNVAPTQAVQQISQDESGNAIEDLDPRSWSIILQACVNRYVSWTPDQKLQWFLHNYSAGTQNALKRLNNQEDLDNTTLSDDPIPNF